MTLQYIAGFFDADGSIYLARNRERETKTVFVSLTNTDVDNLKEMDDLLKEHLIKGCRVSAPKVKDHHLQSYQMQYQGSNAERLMTLIEPFICNRKKIKRWKLYQEQYKPLKRANGKYVGEERTHLEMVALQFNEIC